MAVTPHGKSRTQRHDKGCIIPVCAGVPLGHNGVDQYARAQLYKAVCLWIDQHRDRAALQHGLHLAHVTTAPANFFDRADAIEHGLCKGDTAAHRQRRLRLGHDYREARAVQAQCDA